MHHFIFPKLFPSQYFDMLKDPSIHIKIQNALIIGHKHKIIFLMQMKAIHFIFHFFTFFGVKILEKTFSQNIKKLVKFTFETKRFPKLSHWPLFFWSKTRNFTQKNTNDMPIYFESSQFDSRSLCARIKIANSWNRFDRWRSQGL